MDIRQKKRMEYEVGMRLVAMRDYVKVIMRTEFIQRDAQKPDVAESMIDFLWS